MYDDGIVFFLYLRVFDGPQPPHVAFPGNSHQSVQFVMNHEFTVEFYTISSYVPWVQICTARAPANHMIYAHDFGSCVFRNGMTMVVNDTDKTPSLES